MIATRRGTAVATIVVAAAVAVGATSGRAELAGAVKAPRRVVLDCSTQSGLGGAPGGTFTVARNLVIGPIAIRGAGVRPGYYSPAFRGNKFPLSMRGGHRVTLAIAPRTRDAKLVYGQRGASRVFTFISCLRKDFKRNPYEPHTACCFSFWAGGVIAPSPRCVHLLAWVDDEPYPRQAVIYLGVPDCA
jgi:hypothetical protein